MPTMKNQLESVLLAFIRGQFKKGRCRMCGRSMMTCDEPGLSMDNVCVKCGKEELRRMRVMLLDCQKRETDDT